MKLKRSMWKSMKTTSVTTYNKEKNENSAFVLHVACHHLLSRVHFSFLSICKLQWLTNDITLFSSFVMCEPCQRNWLCSQKWLISWCFTGGFSQGLFVFSNLHPFCFLADISETIGLTVAIRTNTTVTSVNENEGNPLYNLWSDQLCEVVLWELGH